jgi:hypothetical protein
LCSVAVEGDSLMAFKVQVGPAQIAIHQGQSVPLTEPDGLVNWPSNRGLYSDSAGSRDARLIAVHFVRSVREPKRRVVASAAARKWSFEVPPPPNTWIAQSTIRCAMLGATTLIIAISCRHGLFGEGLAKSDALFGPAAHALQHSLAKG